MLLLLALWLAGATTPNPSQPFADCEAQYDLAPAARASAECFYKAGRQGERWRETASHLSRRLARDPDNDWLRYYLGNVHWWSDRRLAIEWYEKAADGFSARGDVLGELTARGNIRTLLMREAKPAEAALQVRRIVEAVEGSTDPELVSRALLLEATHLWDTTQDLGRAERLLREAEGLLFPDGPYDLQSDCLLFLGNVALEQGELERAVSYSRRLEPLARQAGDETTVAAARHNIANALRLQLEEGPREAGRREAIELAREAVSTAAMTGHRQAEVSSHRLVGALLTADEDRREEARWHFERCLELARRYDLRQERGNCLWEYSRLLGKEDPERSWRAAREALAIVRAHGDPAYVAFAWRQAMRAAWLREDAGEALAQSMEALAAVETLRDLQLGERSRAGLFSKWTADYYFVAGQLLRRAVSAGAGGNLADPFAVQERMRARMLVEAGVGAPTTSDLDAVRARLSARQALLAFQLGLWKDLYGDFGGGAWVIVVTSDGTRSVALPDRTRLDSAVEVFLGLVERRDGSEGVLAERLYDLLLKEALAALPPEVEELVVVPDEALHRLPFGALVDGSVGEPLASRFELSVVPSATVWVKWRERNRRALPPAALAFADPAMALADTHEEAEESGWPSVDRGSLGRLPHARLEGRSVVRRFGHGSRVLFDRDASEERLKATDLGGYGVVHFAAHAIVDERHSDRSAILLAPGPGADDGLLHLPEIAALGLDGQLVALSACQTAGGGLLRGEGVLSLARSFFRAGAQAVVASLWPLRDEEAARLFEVFYRHVAGGATASAALRATQREAMGRGMPVAGWAGLVLMGDGTTTAASATTDGGDTAPRLSWIAPLLLLIGVCAFAVWSRRRA